MTWNYRIIDFGTHKALHEVYYDENGNPNAWTAEPAMFACDADQNDIAGALRTALADTERPILHVRNDKIIPTPPQS